jgi:probable HAF family extracellular repeat protein
MHGIFTPEKATQPDEWILADSVTYIPPPYETTYTITLAASPPQGGTVEGDGTFPAGNRTVTATQNPGYSFVNWTEAGPQVASSTSYSFSQNTNRSLLANFARNRTLQPDFEGMGYLAATHRFSTAAAVSEDGTVVVGFAQDDFGTTQAVRWKDGTLVQLSAVPRYDLAAARGVSANGAVVVGEAAGQAFRWNLATGLSPLWDGSAAAVTPDGAIAIGYDNNLQAMTWTLSQGTQEAGYLAEPRGVNADATVVVGVEGNRAIRWTEATGLEFIGPPDSEAWDVSEDGSTIVGCIANKAVIWVGGAERRIGSLAGDDLSCATGVSANGEVVVGISYKSTGCCSTPFRWSASDGMSQFRAFLSRLAQA